jgi:FKBP-type peptidyl-prolyl cis-trans isomerase SlyD
MRSWPIVTCALALLLRVSPTLAEEEKTPVIEEGSRVSIEYTLKLDDGSTADTNVGEEPLVYEQGSHQILPALERELAGMKVEEEREVTLTPEDGYGSVQPELYQEVEAEVIPEDAREKGARLVSEDPNGNRRIVRVHEVKGDRVVLDLNHPLAGQTLHFDVKVLGIE